MSIIVCYFIISDLLESVFDINICIPCLWKTFFGFRCPGCGLTTAFIKLTEFKISEAFEANPLIFILLPFGLLFILSDYNKFRKKSTQ